MHWVSFSFLQAKRPLTITWGQREPSPHSNTIVGSAKPELAPCANSRRSWMTAIAPITSHTKSWKYWRVQSAPTSATVVSGMTSFWTGTIRPTIVFQVYVRRQAASSGVVYLERLSIDLKIIFYITLLNWEFLLKWCNLFWSFCWNRDSLLCTTISIDIYSQISFPSC